jgi:membrane-bound serine protease (ClpP class)
MSGRLILAVISIILEEAALAVIVLVGLPQLDIKLPIFVLVILMLAWAIIAVLVYRAGSRALQSEVVKGFETMTGSHGKVVEALKPSGMVRIKGELWLATAEEGQIAEGEEVVVITRDRKKLIVRPVDE